MSARRPLNPLSRLILLAGGGVTVVLLAVAGRYGYHRDELYFLACGRHLAWGYPDQPPLVPFVARAISALAPHSVWALRIPSALAAGAVTVVAGLSARELAASRHGQLLAAVSMGSGAVLFGVGHLLSTATFDVLTWSLLLLLVLRLLRTGNDRLWLPIGVVAGVGLLASDLVAFLMGALVVGLLLTGPRDHLRSPWLWLGGAVAALMWSPYLVWQAGHGWPQLAIGRSIAAGNSGTSQPRALVLPEQLVLLSPYVAPIWIAGLVRFLRHPDLRQYRAIGIAYLVLAAVFVISGGKSYYLAGMFPVLLGGGAEPAVEWVRRGSTTARRNALVAALMIGLAGSVAATLPLLPVDALHRTPIVAVNYDTGETVGWPAFVAEIASAYHAVAGSSSQATTTAILGSNYGESGAVDHYGPALGLPHAYGVHNGYWYWGPPPASITRVLAIGFSSAQLGRLCASHVLVGSLDNHVRVNDDEQGKPLTFCAQLRNPWTELWPQLRDIG